MISRMVPGVFFRAVLLWLSVLGVAVIGLGTVQASPAPVRLVVAEKYPELRQQPVPVQIDLEALFTTYGRAIQAVAYRESGRLYFRMTDGQKIIYDDGRTKSFEEKLSHPDLEDMLSQPYTMGKLTTLTAVDHDPGRIRVEAFFNAVYGATTAQVRENLVPVNFAGSRVTFNANNGAAAALAKVGARVSDILARNPSLRTTVFPLQGSYNRRQIAGTNRTSAHSWGIALDLHRGSYWRWGGILSPLELLALRAAYPGEIIAAFEEQGFIWGGKWFHYDTMHFEYRPELIAKARLIARSQPGGERPEGR